MLHLCSTFGSLSLSLSHGLCTYQITRYLKELRIDEQISENLSHNGCKTILILHALHKQKACAKHGEALHTRAMNQTKKVRATSIVPKEKSFLSQEQI
jgi:hypothetical protein